MNGCIEQTALPATTPRLFDEAACCSPRKHAIADTLRVMLDTLASPTRPATRLPTTQPTTVRSNDPSPRGFDSSGRNSKLLTHLRPVSHLAVPRRTALKGTRIRFETAVSKIRSRRMKNRKSQARKIDALPNSRQSPRIAQIHHASNRTIQFEVRVESKSWRSRAVRSQPRARTAATSHIASSNGPSLAVSQTMRRSRYTCARASRRTQMCANRHGEALKSASSADNDRFPLAPTTTCIKRRAVRLRNPSQEGRLRGSTVRTRCPFPHIAWRDWTDESTCRRAAAFLASQSNRVSCSRSERKTKRGWCGNRTHASPPKVSVFGSQGEDVRDCAPSCANIANRNGKNRVRRPVCTLQRETISPNRQVRIEREITQYLTKPGRCNVESTHDHLRREIARPP